MATYIVTITSDCHGFYCDWPTPNPVDLVYFSSADRTKGVRDFVVDTSQFRAFQIDDPASGPRSDLLSYVISITVPDTQMTWNIRYSNEVTAASTTQTYQVATNAGASLGPIDMPASPGPEIAFSIQLPTTQIP